mmetsp:Transcript_3755/g.9727  ORF Transcript_3755/g.9727 Transcript_3755/m.9727 type:complete len:304 (-) Transcript_3755:153-1064(-)
MASMACAAASVGGVANRRPTLGPCRSRATLGGRVVGSPASPLRAAASRDSQGRSVDGPNSSAAGIAIDRRQVGLAALLLALAPQQDALAAEEALKTVADATLAYEFKYPVKTASGKPLSMALSRKPEKYSSAAPLSADARQRIVAEVIDLVRAVTVSVTVGPAIGKLKKLPLDEWEAQDVAELVLADRSTARVTSGQRVALNSIEAATKEERSGAPYFLYEHVSQGAPNLASGKLESYRHALAVTTTRPAMDGSLYLYTLNLACPDDTWDDLLPYFQECVDAFHLTATTKAYVPPDKDPWLFF